LIQMFW